ncbi:MAG: sigma-54 dependent transcriptional regulator [Gemmatimonadota bacterium]
MANSILIIDDDIALLQSLGAAFEHEGWDVHRELAGEAGLATFNRVQSDVVLVDLHLPGMDGLEVLDALNTRNTAVIVLTGDDHLPTAVRAMTLGAENFLLKPVDLAHLLAASARAAEKVRLRRVNQALVGQSQSGALLDILGAAPAMHRLREQAVTLAQSDRMAIVIEGETGSGRAEVARLIHEHSLRRGEAFIETTATSTNAQALEATLFGVEGDVADGRLLQPGLIQVADQGTLLLREIGQTPLPVQARLAELLEQRAIRRLGGVREIPIDVRLIFTTSLPIGELATQGTLEPGLFFRIKSGRLEVPPLRELSPSDQAVAMQRILRLAARGVPGAPPVLADSALERLVAHPWPGNFLEVRHVLERACLLARGRPAIGVEHLPGEFRDKSGPFDRRHTPLAMAEVERMHIERTLKHHEGNRTRAAEELGISRATLIAKIKRYAIPH